MKTYSMRKAFSMITAIFLIVIMASISAFVMNLSGKIVKTTSAQYRNAQAELYTKSYMEFAVLAIQGHDRTAVPNCVQQINGQIGGPVNIGGYRIRALISYIGNTSVTGTAPGCPATRLLTAGIVTPTTPLSAIIDVYVTYQDMDTAAGLIMTVHRRTIQKI